MSIWQSGGVNQQGHDNAPAFVHAWTETTGQTLVMTAGTHYVADQMDATGPELGVDWDTSTGFLTIGADGGGHYFLVLTATCRSNTNNTELDIHGQKLIGETWTDQNNMGIAATEMRTSNSPYQLATVGCFTAVAGDQYRFELRSDTNATITFDYLSILIFRVAETALLP